MIIVKVDGRGTGFRGDKSDSAHDLPSYYNDRPSCRNDWPSCRNATVLFANMNHASLYQSYIHSLHTSFKYSVYKNLGHFETIDQIRAGRYGVLVLCAYHITVT